MKIQTSTLSPNLSPHDTYQVYNGLDCCLTFEIFDVLSDQLRTRNQPYQEMIYGFERGMQGPALELMERGWRVDPVERQKGIELLSAKREKLKEQLNLFARAIWDKDLNANSPAQLKSFFYERMGFPEQRAMVQGRSVVSTNREALEKLEPYFYAKPFTNTILAIRDCTKKLSVLETEISRDGRMRTSYNVAGTETGRWSSSSSADGTGTNLQNITPELRRMFVADPGWKLCYLDLEQAESRVVGLLVWRTCADPTYLDACESGDLHTTVSTLVWPHIKTREDADRPFYRHFTYRDMAKRGGHGTNYYGTPPTMARHLKVETKVIVGFQNLYCGPIVGKSNAPFKGIRTWQAWVGNEIRSHQSLTTLLGRQRTFYGRANDDATLREAIAFEPQSVVGDLLNCALWRIWNFEPRVQILGQIHDAIVFQYPDNPATEVEILNSCRELTRIPISARGRTIIIPSECQIGWNWGKNDPKSYKDGNPNGLRKFKGVPDDRKRVA